jgi:hypothetical protein
LMEGAESAGRTVRGELEGTRKSPTRRVSAAPVAPTTHSARLDHCRPRPLGIWLLGAAVEPVNFL